MRGVTLGLLVLALSACAPSRRRWQPREVTGSASSAFVVIALDAPLHTAPSRRAPALRLARGASRTPWVGRRLAVFRILGEQGGWAELESPGRLDDGHCASGPRALRALRLRMFTPSASLVPVTVRDVTQSFADDTSIALSRGVPVEPLPGTRLFRARLGALSAVVRLGVSDTGSRYLPSPPRPEPARVGFLGPRAFATGAPILGQTGRVTNDVPDLLLPYYALVPRGTEERVVELRPDCGVLRVRVPADQLTDEASALLGRLVDNREPALAIEPGAEVTWSDGRVAGQTVERLPVGDELAERDGRRCFAHPLRPGASDPDATVELCFDPADVRSSGAGLGAQLARP